MSSSTGSVAIDLLLPFVTLFVGSAAILGFTHGDSLLRIAWLPVNVTAIVRVILNASLYTRGFWARGLGAFASGITLQYIDVALISKWTVEVNPRASSTMKQKQANALSRLSWGFWALFDSRRLNTPDEVKNQQSLPRWVLRSSINFVLYELGRAAFFYVVTDVLTPYPPSPLSENAEVFSVKKIPIFARLLQGEPVPPPELVFRTIFSIIYWYYTFTTMEVVLSLTAVATILTGACRPSDHKFFFGSLGQSYTLRGFWGKTWHQSLRHPFGKPAEWLVDGVGLAKTASDGAAKRWIRKYLIVLITFAVSGVFHVAGDVASGDKDIWSSGTMRYYVLQALGILLEDHVQDLYNAVRDRNKRPGWWTFVFGYAWTLAFITWTTPIWVFPIFSKVDPEQAQPFLPFSLVETYHKHSNASPLIIKAD